jgi:hypothetical protein
MRTDLFSVGQGALPDDGRADADAARMRALATYKNVLVFWKDAEPGIPTLKRAKAEHAELK